MTDAISPSDADTKLRLRRVHRAASELRRGVPVVIEGTRPMLAVSAETGGSDAVVEIAAAGGTPVLVLSPPRAATVLRAPMQAGATAVGVALPEAARDAKVLRQLADPIAPAPILAEKPQVATPPADADAAIQLAKIARLLPAVVVAEGDAPDLLRVSASDIMAYGAADADGLRQIVSADVPLHDAPDSRVVMFRSEGSELEHLAIVVGKPEKQDAPLVRLHSECFTGDLLGSMRCDCGEQLRGALRKMTEDGSGVLLYLAQEGRGIGLVNKLRAYRLQDRGLDTMDANRALGWGADERNFAIAANMLRLLGVTTVRLLTNNPDKMDALQAAGITVAGREPHMIDPNGINDEYLATKAARFGHMLD